MASPIHALLALLVALPSVVSAALAAQRGVQASRSRFRSAAAPPIYTASSLSDYHLGCKRLASADDTVLEVGCQLGGTTELLAARAARVIGIDIDRALDTTRGARGPFRSHGDPASAGLPDTGGRLAKGDPPSTERERGRERERDRETERQRDRETERQRDRERETGAPFFAHDQHTSHAACPASSTR